MPRIAPDEGVASIQRPPSTNKLRKKNRAPPSPKKEKSESLQADKFEFTLKTVKSGLIDHDNKKDTSSTGRRSHRRRSLSEMSYVFVEKRDEGTMGYTSSKKLPQPFTEQVYARGDSSSGPVVLESTGRSSSEAHRIRQRPELPRSSSERPVQLRPSHDDVYSRPADKSVFPVNGPQRSRAAPETIIAPRPLRPLPPLPLNGKSSYRRPRYSSSPSPLRPASIASVSTTISTLEIVQRPRDKIHTSRTFHYAQLPESSTQLQELAGILENDTSHHTKHVSRPPPKPPAKKREDRVFPHTQSASRFREDMDKDVEYPASIASR